MGMALLSTLSQALLQARFRALSKENSNADTICKIALLGLLSEPENSTPHVMIK